MNDDSYSFGVCLYHRTSLILYEGVPVCKACLAKNYGVRI